MNTKLNSIVAFFLCFAVMPFTGCVSMGDDAFAIYAKRGNTSAALANIKPYSGQLRVTEVNGRTYYPIEYSLINGDRRLTYALIDNGSPTRLYGRSLAYNAAYAGNDSLAKELASDGFGSTGDISAARARLEADRRRRAKSNEMAALFGLGILAMLMSGGGGGGGHSDSHKINGHDSGAVIQAMQNSGAQGW